MRPFICVLRPKHLADNMLHSVHAGDVRFSPKSEGCAQAEVIRRRGKRTANTVELISKHRIHQ